jgi:hypothetical protein
METMMEDLKRALDAFREREKEPDEVTIPKGFYDSLTQEQIEQVENNFNVKIKPYK